MAVSDQKVLWPGWETVRLIGRGSFGAVYEIRRDMLGEIEKAALKVITIPQSDSDISEMYSDGYDEESITSTFKEHLKSIVAEYSLMRKLNGSSNVVNCDDVRYVQHDDGIGWDIFIKMELLTPLTSAVALDTPEEQVIKIAKDLCHALVQCKQFGIIHRDIKPQNIFVSPLGDYKLGDFGIAKTVEKTSGGTKIGTYKYMAPEVYNNQPYGAGVDIYSLGLVLYWLLNERRLPFLPLPPEKLRAGMEEETRIRRFNGEQIPAPAHGSEALKRIVLKACAYDPKDRYQSAEKMLRELESLDSGSQDHAADTQGKPSEEMEDDSTVDTAVECTEQKEESTVSAIRSEAPREEGSTGRNIEDEETVSAFREGATMKERGTGRRVEDEATVSAFTPKESDHSGQNPTPARERKKMGKWVGLLGGLAAVLLLVVALLPKGQKTAPETTAQLNDKAAVASAEAPAPTPTLPPTATPTPTAEDADLEYSQFVAHAGRAWIVSPDGLITVIPDVDSRAKQSTNPAWSVLSESNVKQISFDWTTDPIRHVLVLKRDGSVVAYGDNFIGECNVSDWEDVIQVVAIFNASFGLKADGTVFAAGGYLEEFPVGIHYTDSVVDRKKDYDLSAWRNIIAISCDSEAMLLVGVRNDGTLVSTDLASLSNYTPPGDYLKFNDLSVQLSMWSGIKNVALGVTIEFDKMMSNRYAVGLRTDGSVVIDGGLIGDSCTAGTWHDIVSVATEDGIIIGLTERGTVLITDAVDESRLSKRVINELSEWKDIIDIAISDDTIIGLQKNGNVLFCRSIWN